jgi:hypothetical protein
MNNNVSCTNMSMDKMRLNVLLKQWKHSGHDFRLGNRKACTVLVSLYSCDKV